ncbi:MAG: 2-iminoacetate synthase [Petroclostridium sp.]|jgi:2-iminoacetate synthase|uniref:[FeFe] hydrogenase H-cluster radical SAM maturase HydG n=1 Tax=Petroclostridium xylanilyticum TaxID=1792311 RepID=UPI000B9982F7|nr:[FeFe] hydrogenase H-cluster radical SAM maturase HydG [Petroclostridium xylanilyticum]MBZ4644887.1 iron-only hydrogenase maturation protein HydG [Clostridia bacterium]MDK2809366.1 2-iminoacetate synthase [Petroclostridium sp.]
MELINEGKISKLLSENSVTSKEEISELILKARECKGLTLEETAKLLNIEEDSLLEDLFKAAKYVKEKIYGKRIVLFAPLYTSNECNNNCLYCGFRAANKELHRKTLTVDEIVNEAKEIEKQGHKRILMVCGEDKNKTHIDHITDALAAIYASCDIRRINVNAAPMTVEEFGKLKKAGIGTYQLFQETYHRDTYKKMHPAGKKADYEWRLTAMERALEAGIDDLGIGALLGLYDYKFEVLAMLEHSDYLLNKYGVGPHTISVPRLRPALGSVLKEAPYPMNDRDFKKLVAVLRLAVPYTGIILSTRESAALRDELLSLGVSQISAGSKTSPGGYGHEEEKSDQFYTTDHRSLNQMVKAICSSGYIPSFCTACYRRCRTGEHFMELAREGEIHTFCQPNAVLTFKENLIDYGTPEDRAIGEEIIQKALEEIEDVELKQATVEKLKLIEEGQRDLYF